MRGDNNVQVSVAIKVGKAGTRMPGPNRLGYLDRGSRPLALPKAKNRFCRDNFRLSIAVNVKQAAWCRGGSAKDCTGHILIPIMHLRDTITIRIKKADAVL